MDTIPPRHCNACGDAIWHRQAFWEFHCWPSLDPRTYCIDCITHIVFVAPATSRGRAVAPKPWPGKRRPEAAWPKASEAERSEPSGKP